MRCGRHMDKNRDAIWPDLTEAEKCWAEDLHHLHTVGSPAQMGCCRCLGYYIVPVPIVGTDEFYVECIYVN